MPDSTLLKIAGYGSLFVAIKHAVSEPINSNPYQKEKEKEKDRLILINFNSDIRKRIPIPSSIPRIT